MKNRFLQAVASTLEVERVSLDDEFRDVEDWCSLKAFGLLVMLENDWHAPTTVDRLLELKTVRDLYREAFVAFAADVLKVDRARLRGTTSRGMLPEWDHAAHLRLVVEAEKRFGACYPPESIPCLRTINDFLEA